MKKTVQYIALAALTLSLAACQQDNALQEINDPNAVKINATIGALQSRVTYGDDGATSFSNGDGIKVQNTKRTSKNEATYTYNGATWSIQEGSLVWNSGENTNQFNAWYPATASYDSFELPTDQSDASKLAAADWMTATTVDMSKPSNCELGLTFAHKLAKVTVNISETHGSQFDNAPTLDEVKIYTHNGTKTITPMAGTNSYTAIVTPGQYNGPNNFMTFKVGEDEFTVKPTTTLTTGLEAGKHYTFTLTVGKDKATIGNVEVNPWTDGTAIPGGEAEEVPVINYVWTSVIVASESVEGEGTEASPYLIHSANDLQWMIDQVKTNGVTGKYFQLTHDLEIDSEEGATWKPIGTADNPFVGNFDGGGYTISGEMHTTTDLVGFFGYNAGSISNLKNEAEVEDCRILMPVSNDYSAIGSIAGYSTGKIIHCENSGNVTAPSIFTTTYTGGICGYQYRDNYETIALITECKNSGAVTGVAGDGKATGGIVGRSDGYMEVYALIMACENAGSVTTGDKIGGICGLAEGPTAIVACLNTGDAGVCGIFGGDFNYDLNGCCTTKGYIGPIEVDSESFYACYTFDENYADKNKYVDYSKRGLVEDIVGPWNVSTNIGYDEMNYVIVLMNSGSIDEYQCNWHWEVGEVEENYIPKLVEGAPLGNPDA